VDFRGVRYKKNSYKLNSEKVYLLELISSRRKTSPKEYMNSMIIVGKI
jgi:hypothetical protein